MENFFFGIPTRVFFGVDAIQYLGFAIRKEDAKRVLFAYGGGSIQKNGVYDHVVKGLDAAGLQFVEFPGIRANSPLDDVHRGIDLCREHHVDLVLAVGGGSVIDACKAIAAGVPYTGDIRDLLAAGATKIESALPLGTVLTIAGTGSELDSGAVITVGEDHKKVSVVHPLLYPRFSILDPTYTYSVPEHASMAGSFDTLSHLMESYFLPDATTEVQDRMNEGVMKAILRNAPRVKANPRDYNARANIMWASSMALAGFQFSLGKTTIDFPVHSLGHELSSLYGMTHGDTLALLTPAWMQFVLRQVPESVLSFATFARNVFGVKHNDDSVAASRGIAHLEAFIAAIGLPHCLKEAGVEKDRLAYLADKATEFGPLGGLCSIDRMQALEILEAAWE